MLNGTQHQRWTPQRRGAEVSLRIKAVLSWKECTLSSNEAGEPIRPSLKCEQGSRSDDIHFPAIFCNKDILHNSPPWPSQELGKEDQSDRQRCTRTADQNLPLRGLACPSTGRLRTQEPLALLPQRLCFCSSSTEEHVAPPHPTTQHATKSSAGLTGLILGNVFQTQPGPLKY